MVMGYNVSGGVYPSLRIGGRLAGDAPGTMTEELTLAAGSGSQTGSCSAATTARRRSIR